MQRKPLARLWLVRLLMLGLCASTLPMTATAQKTRPSPVRSGKTAKTSKGELKTFVVQVRKLLIDRAFGKAIKALQTHPKTRSTETLLFLLARAQALNQKYLKAAATYLEFARRFPDSSLHDKALLSAAGAYSKARRFDKAQAINGRILKKLLSDKRRLEIANFFLRYARRYAKTKGRKRHSHLRKASSFFQKALALGLPASQKRKVSLELAKAYLGINYKYQARRLLQNATREFPKGPLADQLMFLYAQSQRYSGSKRRALQDFLVKFKKSGLRVKALMLLARSYGVPGSTSTYRRNRGIDVLRRLIREFPKHPLAVKALFFIPKTYYSNGRYKEAIADFQAFLKQEGAKKHDSNRYNARARYSIGRALFLQKKYMASVEAYRAFLKAHSTDRLWPSAQRQIIQAYYQEANNAWSRNKWKKATTLFKAFLKRYPLNGSNATVMYRLGQIAYKQKKYKQAIEAWQKVVSKYPTHSYGYLAQWRIAQTWETKLVNYAKAIELYRKIRYYSYRYRARRAIKRLSAVALSVLTPRVFTTGSKAFVEVSSRNIQGLKLRLYKIDAETYFRKMLRFGGMTNLDTELIRPDRKWSVNVPKYRKYHLFKTRIPMNSKKPMVAVVEVAGKTLVTKTVVVVSNLQIITKAGARSMFVFALNGKKRVPLGGTRLLISNGSKIVLEGKTDKQGVFRSNKKVLHSCKNLNVLALKNGSVAANNGSLYGISYSSGLSAAGLIYTDRAAYRPGETVHAKALLREVKKGQYILPTKPYVFEVRSIRGQVLFQKTLKPTEFGSFAASFKTFRRMKQGSYILRLSRQKGVTLTGRFRVTEYKLPRYRIALKLKRRVFLRNQVIKATVKVTYGFGGPVASKKVTVRFYNQYKTLKTNERGEIQLSYKTTALNLNRVYSLYARVYGTSVSVKTRVWLRETAFDLSLSTIRTVYAAGENFEVKVKAVDPAGRRYSPKVKLTLYRRQYTNGRWVETQAASALVKLGAGADHASFKVSKGGYYTLRASTRDLFKHKVSASRSLYISGDEDKTVLRLLSNRQSVWVGDKETVKLLARKSGPALVTYEGESVLKHFFFPNLAKGLTRLPVIFTRELSPNFALRVALLGPKRLHTAQKYFTVSRRLQIVLRPKKRNLRPGETAEIMVETRDQSGRPVQAELSLAVVNKALLQLYPDTTPALASIFYKGRRRLQIKTLSSHTWRYSARGRKIASILLKLAQQKKLQEKARQMRRRYRRRFKRYRRLYRGGVLGNLGGRSRNGSLSGLLKDKNDSSKMPPPPPAAVTAKPYPRPSYDNGNQPTVTITTGASRFLQGLRKKFKTTAFWDPNIRTDAKGRAVVKFTVPDDITGWKIFARGVAKVTLVGEGFSALRTSKPLMSELRLPSRVTEGDVFAPNSTLHNKTGKTVKIKAVLSIPGWGPAQSRVLTLKANRSTTLEWGTWKVKANKSGFVMANLRVTALAGKKEFVDQVERELLVRKAGVEMVKASSGILRNRRVLNLRLSSLAKYRHPRMELHLAPWKRNWLMPVIRFAARTPGDSSAALAHRMGVLMEGLRLAKQQGKSDSPEVRQLRSQLEQLSRALWARQSYYGGWSFSDRRYYPNEVFSAAVLSLLAEAATKWGVFSPPGELKKTRLWLRKKFYGFYAEKDKVRLLYALAHSASITESVLFAYANRLLRKRRSLSLKSLSWLGLALIDLDRASSARQLVPLVKARLQTLLASRVAFLSQKRAASLVDVALGTRFLVQLAPKAAVLAKAQTTLLSHRIGFGWGSSKVDYFAISALSLLTGQQQLANVKLKIRVRVNGKLWKTLSFVNTSPVAHVTFRDFDPNKNLRLELEPVGQGAVFFTAEVRGTTSKPPLFMNNRYQRIKRHYKPTPRVVQGLRLSPGNSILRSRRTRIIRKLKRLRRGETTLVTLRIYRRNRKDRSGLVVEESLPAGAVVLRSSISSNRYSLLVHADQGRLRFLLNESQNYWVIKYRLVGAYVGHYKVPATRVWSFDNPALMSLGKPYTLRVVSANAKPESYPLTPNELFYLGRHLYNRKKFKQAKSTMERLLKNYRLRSWYLKRATRMLLNIALKQKDMVNIVAHFEQLKELTPSAFLPLEQVALVGQAYASQKEYERADMVFLAAMDSRFVEEMKVAATLEKEGEFKDAMKFIRRLVLQYPDLREVQNTFYALAQSAVQRSTNSSIELPKRLFWRQRAWKWLHNFQWMFPLHPSVDAASYTQANLLLQMGELGLVVKHLKHSALLYPRSQYLASMHYLQAYALYLLRRDKRAMTLLKSVSSRRYPDGRGNLVRSKDRFLAMYLMAQIHHARQKYGKALKLYRKIRLRFPDAASQVKYLGRVVFKLPEVTAFSPTEGVSLALKHQNIRKFTVLVYRVDLMKLYLLKKNLNAVTRINLAGIRPTLRTKVVLKKPALFAASTFRLKLPVKKQGSYLVVLKSKDREVSGIVLRTALRLKVQEEKYTGRITAFLTHRKTGAPVSKATVRVVGSRDGRFRSGKTDLRGIYAVNKVRGKATIIAQKGDDFAFFRGQSDLRPRRRRVYRRRYGYGRYRPTRRRYKKKERPGLLDNVNKQNSFMQRQGRGQLLRLYRMKRKGVQMKFLK